MKKIPLSLINLLDTGISPAFKKIFTSRRDQTARLFLAHRLSVSREPTLTDEVQLAIEVVQFLKRQIDIIRNEIECFHKWLDDFNYRYSRVKTRRERQSQILLFARQLGAGFWQRRGDRRAFSRWFDHDAVTERCLHKVAVKESDLIFCLTIMGALSEKALSGTAEEDRQRQVWRQLNLEQHLRPLLAYIGDSRVRLQAFKCLVMAIRALDGDSRENSLSQRTVSFIHRSALESGEDIWLQVEALNLLASFSLTTLKTVLAKRLSVPKDGDDIFVRRHCAVLMVEMVGRDPDMIDLFAVSAEDKSAFVRQAAAESAVTAYRNTGDHRLWRILEKLVLDDATPQVRAGALYKSVLLVESEGLSPLLIRLWKTVFSRENDSSVIRTGLKSLRICAARLADIKPDRLSEFCDAVFPMLKTLHGTAVDISVRRWSAQTREWLIVLADPALRSLFYESKSRLASVQPGKSCKLRRPFSSAGDTASFYRTLAVIAQADYGMTVSRTSGGYRLWRGDIYVFRVWRLLFEFLHPSPYKRQGFSHTIGRFLPGPVRIPSAKMSELTRTSVPGEPFFMPEEGGWRPYLPLVDDVLSSLFIRITAPQASIYTSEGVTVITPPPSLIKRLRAWWRLTTRFQHFADLRNWQPQSYHKPNAYTEQIAELGIDVSFESHSGPDGQPQTDPEVRKFFPAVLPFFNADLWPEFKDYFFSVYGNSLYEMGIFAFSLFLLFLVRRIYLKFMGRRARKRLPLVIGGWGTRGKSGTERLKAALFEALGYRTVAKTTGTEAMFLMAYPMGRTREMMLFRPYDKASIWEQHALNRWAAGVNTEVLLWECMGLNPYYVKILQNNWCKDDFSTITNTYPDHEDIQGPAGINIPQVMNEFIPEQSVLITAEEQMLPVLKAGAKQKKTVVKSVDWFDAGMITPDILDRFPYQEHPYNIALVLKLAREFGISENFALKEMADRVIPDIGSLKAYPEALRNHHRMVFINGMSANDRFAALNNWRRMGFDSQDVVHAASGLQTILVNNRADRVSRSRMFASIIVADISVDHIVLIGSNLTGMMAFIHKAWNDFIRDYDFVRSGSEQLVRVARHLRLPVEESMVRQRLAVMLDHFFPDGEDYSHLIALRHEPQQLKIQIEKAGLSSADDIVAHIHQYNSRYRAFTALYAKLTSESRIPHEAPAEEIRTFLKKCFFDKIHVIADANAGGEFIVQQLFDLSPPGLLQRVMGMQNIKGPGLNFVYRWQSWEACYHACNKLRADDQSVVKEGLHDLSAFQNFGLLCEQYVKDTLERVRTMPVAQSEHFQAALVMIRKKMEAELTELQEAILASSRSGRVFYSIFNFLETFLDAGDGIRRRKAASRIYRDLKTGRISHNRAAVELHNLHKRQKGGWLLEQFLGMVRKIFGVSRQLP